MAMCHDEMEISEAGPSENGKQFRNLALHAINFRHSLGKLSMNIINKHSKYSMMDP